MYTCIPSFLDFFPIQDTRSHPVKFLVLYRRFSLVISFINSIVYMSVPISQFIPPSPFPLGIHSFVLYDCVSVTALQVRSSTPFFQIPHICVNNFYTLLITQFSSVARSFPNLCDPMDCSMPAFPIHYELPELTQIHVYQVRDAIQPSHPLLSPSPSAFSLSQHQGLFQ